MGCSRRFGRIIWHRMMARSKKEKLQNLQ